MAKMAKQKGELIVAEDPDPFLPSVHFRSK